MANEYEGEPMTLPGARYGIVVARYNESVTRRLLAGALETLSAAGVPEANVDIAWVPGAWEIPVIAQRFARAGRHAAVICLGAVVRGETTHDQHINRQVSLNLGRIALQFGLPVLFGVLTCNTMEQAMNRAGGNAGNKGSECAEAALRMTQLLAKLH